MKALLTGGTGYIGRHVVRALRSRGATCTVISRGGHGPWTDDPGVRVLRANPATGGDWQAAVAAADVVINLAGAKLVDPPHRWTRSRKRTISDSRVDTTTRITEAIAAAHPAPRVFLSGSAVGYYGSRGDEQLAEDAAPGTGFLAEVCRAWERAASAPGATRVVALRTGMVLGKDSPLLHSMVPPFKLGVGGPWGTGRQWWPWVHIDDVVALILFAIDKDVTGPLNVVAPAPVRVGDFARALGRALHRPAVARVPAIVLRMALGELADALLSSQRVIPAAALAAGYRFEFAELTAALDDILSA